MYYDVKVDGNYDIHFIPLSFPQLVFASPGGGTLEAFLVSLSLALRSYNQGRRLVLPRAKRQVQAVQGLRGVLYVCPTDAPSEKSSLSSALVPSLLLCDSFALFFSFSSPRFTP